MEPTNETQTATQTATAEPALPMAPAGERPLLLSHREYARAREQGHGLGDYDLLMLEPEDPGLEDDKPQEQRWVAVRADKYLKHRAIDYREAESLSELPSEHRSAARERAAFSPANRSRRRKEGETA